MSDEDAVDVPWEKVLWKVQPYPDNYIPPEAFLAELRRNTNFTPYTYWPLVLAACAITQHLATIITFLAVFVRLKERVLDARLLICITIPCYIFGYALWEIIGYGSAIANGRVRRAKAFKSSILVFLSLLGLSPVLKTLTAATSSDSIWALSAFLFFLNALLSDYNPEMRSSPESERLISVLSMNAAISASVVLASRLSDDLGVFALILFAVVTFSMFPMLRRRLQATSPFVRIVLTIMLCIICLFLTWRVSRIATYLYVTTLFAVTFIAPGVLVWAQKYKNEIRGPWDVAVPRVGTLSTRTGS